MSTGNERDTSENMESLHDMPVTDGLIVVGIGASTGGEASLYKFFQEVSENDKISYILVMAFSNAFREKFMAHLRKASNLRVKTIGDGQQIEANTVHVIPVDKDVALQGHVLKLHEPLIFQGLRLPIDFFFRSLAHVKKEKSVGIIFSGEGTDGTLGVKEIKEHGGMVMVQDTSTAELEQMPQHAIATGMADYTMPPGDMPAVIYKYIQKTLFILSEIRKSKNRIAISDENIQRILHLLAAHTGHDFTFYKSNTVIRRLTRRLTVNKCPDLNHYINFLEKNPAEINFLFNEILIGVTNFFRDGAPFEFLENTIIPELFKKPADVPVRVWVPACSTGEEAYSLAMLLHQYRQKVKKDHEIKIFASDIDNYAVNQARYGLYPESIAADVPPKLLATYFEKKQSHYEVIPELREMIVFAVHSLIKDPPYSRMDLISCRNLLIYFDNSLQKKVLDMLHFSLLPEGYLMLGNSENINLRNTHFKTVGKNEKVFQKIDVQPSRRSLNIPRIESIKEKIQVQEDLVKPPFSLKQVTEQKLLENHAPDSLLINGEGEILYIHGKTDKYLEQITGLPTRNILKMAREGLRIPLSNAIRKIKLENASMIGEVAKYKYQDTFKFVYLKVQKVKNENHEQEFILVSLQDMDSVFALANESIGNLDKKVSNGDRRIIEMERELKITQDFLQSTIEELETSNEELKTSYEEAQSANEEMHSVNEELETSKEELQSANEELITLNNELQDKIDELVKLNNDMNNLLTCTDIGIVFLDSDLNISRFTPSVKSVINIMPSDIGRPIQHISTNLEVHNLVEKAHEVLEHDRVEEEEVKTVDGKHYWQRVLPYKTMDNKINGVVLTFTDISKQKAAEEKFRSAFQTTPDAVTLNRLNDGLYTDVNQGFENLTGYARHEVIGKTSYEVKIWNDYHDRERMAHLLQEKGMVQNFEAVFISKDGRKIPGFMSANIVTIQDEKYILAITRDISEMKENQEKIRENEYLLKQFQKIGRIGGWEVDVYTGRLHLTEEVYDIFRNPGEPVNHISDIHPYFSKESQEEIETTFQTVIEKPRKFELVLPAKTHDNRKRWVKMVGDVVINERGEVQKIRGTLQDVTKTVRIRKSITRAKEKAEEADRLKSAFLANMSHEIRTPMNGILGFAELMRKDGLAPEKKKKFLDIIQSNGKHLMKLINDIIDISKIESNQVKIEKRKFNLNELLNEMYVFFHEARESMGRQHVDIKLSLCACPAYCLVFSDPARLRQVLTNLLNNALKYTQEGKVEFGYYLSEIRSKKYLHFFVKDTGPGIPKEKQKMIFGRFSRGEEEYQLQQGGAGLGLSITQGLVELLGGKIRLESEVNMGSTFFFTLEYHPIYETPGGKPLFNHDIDRNLWENKTALVAVNDDNCFLFMNDLLGRMPGKVLHARSAKEARKILEKNPVDIILLDADIIMKEGVEEVRAVKKAGKNSPLVLQYSPKDKISGEDMDHGLIDNKVVKPLDSRKWIKIIDDCYKKAARLKQ